MVNTHLRNQKLESNKLMGKADNEHIFVGPMRPNSPLAPPIQQTNNTKCLKVLAIAYSLTKLV